MSVPEQVSVLGPDDGAHGVSHGGAAEVGVAPQVDGGVRRCDVRAERRVHYHAELDALRAAGVVGHANVAARVGRPHAVQHQQPVDAVPVLRVVQRLHLAARVAQHKPPEDANSRHMEENSFRNLTFNSRYNSKSVSYAL